ncbi:hypothetical protein ABK040_010787 [Willaertia magna]
MSTTADLLPDEIWLHIFMFLTEKECYESICFTKKHWILNLYPIRKEVLSFNYYSELNRYIQFVLIPSSSPPTIKKKNVTSTVTLGTSSGSVIASTIAPQIEEKKLKIQILFDSLDKFNNLKSIYLINCGLNDSIVEKICLTFKKNLKILNISKNKNLSHSVLKNIMLCENLKELNISYNFQNIKKDKNELFELLKFPPNLEILNISGLLNEIPTFEEYFKLLKINIKTIIAYHLTNISLLTIENIQQLILESMSSLIELYNHCFIYLKTNAFQMIYNELRFYPDNDLIYKSIENGHSRVLDLLNSIQYPINELLPIEIIENIIRNKHYNVISKLRMYNYSRFNELSNEIMNEIIRNGDDETIVELRRISYLNRSLWDSINIESISEAIRNGYKGVIDHIRMLNLIDKINQVDIKHVNYAIEKGYTGVIKQLVHSNYQKINDIDPTIAAEAIIKNSSIEQSLRNANYKKLDKVKLIMNDLLKNNNKQQMKQMKKRK